MSDQKPKTPLPKVPDGKSRYLTTRQKPANEKGAKFRASPINSRFL